MAAFAPSGNRAFDEYRSEALRKLEEEAAEFRAFLERLRMAKDRAEFDEFMKERRDRPAGSGEGPQDPTPQPPELITAANALRLGPSGSSGGVFVARAHSSLSSSAFNAGARSLRAIA